MASPYRQSGSSLFVSIYNNNNYLKLFYILKRGEIWEHWHCHLFHKIFACVVCVVHWPPLHWRAYSPHQMQVWGRFGVHGPGHGFILHSILNSGANYISLSTQMGILCVFLNISPSILSIDVFCPLFYPFCPVWGPPLIATLVLKLALKW